LLGRDGNELKQWLKKNKQVKIVSRDRAGSYAAAISEILPDAIQVADRFHIYHNLLIAVKEAINGILPDKVLITDEPTNIETEKKLSLRAIEAQEKEIRRKEIILEARRLFQEEKLSKVEICTKLGITYKRLRKYLAGNPDMVCKNGNTGQSRGSILDRYHNVIAELLDESKQYKEIHQTLFEYGCKVGYTTLFDYCIKMFGNKCETIKYHSNREQHYVTRKQILKYIWSHKPLEEYDKQWVFSLYPELFIIRDSVSGFRHAVEQMNEILLKDWIHQEANSLIPRIKSFCNGILRDLEPVLNSVRYTTNNAFLEGNVNRLKMIKRTMYGRAGYGLLGAKVLNGIFRV
jgi:predicted transcriptional regulator